MPEGRWVPKSLNDDYRLNSVSLEAEILYRKMWNTCDREARLKADPKWVNKTYFPLRDYNDKEVEGWLQDLMKQKKNGLGLIEIYEVEGFSYLWLPDFGLLQTNSWLHTGKAREKESIIPQPPEKGKKAFKVE